MTIKSFRDTQQISYGATNFTGLSADVILGTKAIDNDGNEYMLLKGVTGLDVGDVVLYDKDYNTVRAVEGAQTATNFKGLAVYAGESDNIADDSTKAGYFCIYGTVSANVSAGVTQNGDLYLSATPGELSNTGTTQVAGILASSNPIANVANITIFSPVPNLLAGTGGGGGGSAAWGGITGTLSAQTDLNTALTTLQDNIDDITDGTTPITTAQITGGTINGTVIGGTTPAAGTFTTLSVTGNSTIGDNPADTSTVNATQNFATQPTGIQGASISNTASGNISATDVQAAINELDTEKEPTITATTSADYYRGDKTFQTLNGLAVANTPAGNIAATTTQAAINELDTEKAGLATANTFTAANDFSGGTITDSASYQVVLEDSYLLDGTLTAVPFTAERIDTDNMHDNAVNNTRITFTTAGTYVVTASNDVYDVAGSVRTSLILNGITTLAETGSFSGDGGNGSIAVIRDFASNDYVELFASDVGGGSFTGNFLFSATNTSVSYPSGGGTLTNISSSNGALTVTNPTTTPILTVNSAPILTTARTIAGVSFDGSANIAIASTNLSNTANIPLKDTANVFTASQVMNKGVERLLSTTAFSATPTIDWSTAADRTITLTGNITSFTFTAPVLTAGYIKRLTLRLTQDGTGSRTATGWPASVKFAGGTSPTLTTTASKSDIITFDYDGTNYYGVISQNF
jgi:hypothetical protein